MTAQIAHEKGQTGGAAESKTKEKTGQVGKEDEKAVAYNDKAHPQTQLVPLDSGHFRAD